MNRRPNILMIIVDQLTALATTMGGNTVVKTPNIDRLASRGAVLRNAYCAYPLCGPSRYSLMTGTLPSRIGAYDNAAELPAATPTFAHYARAKGYRTVAIGKMHFVGPDQLHGFEDRLTTDVYPSDFGWTPTDYLPGQQDVLPSGTSSVESLADSGPMVRTMQLDYDEEVSHRTVQQLFDVARWEGEPFLMVSTFTQPHDPYITSVEHWNRYSDADIDSPRVAPIGLEARDTQSRSLYYHYSQHKIEITDAVYRRARRAYYGMVSYIDDQVGKILKALEDCGLADDTIVVFTSDHGDMIGERGMWFKKTLFEPAVRIPLVVSGPGILGGQAIDTPVSLVDLFPTILDWVGGGEPQGHIIDGHSLLPLLRGKATGEQLIFAEHLSGCTVSPRVMVRKGRYKYVFSHDYAPQLYDLESDPDELMNLAGSSGLREQEDELQVIVARRWDLRGLLDAMQREHIKRTFLANALAIGRRTTWDFEPARNASREFVRGGDDLSEVERRGNLRLRRSV